VETSLVLKSTALLTASIVGAMGVPANRAVSAGDLVSSKGNAIRTETVCVWELGSLSDLDIERLDTFSTGLAQLEGVMVEFFIRVDARPLGHVIEIDALLLQWLVSHGAALFIDAYDSQSDDEQS
jgi:hypothetical protein